MGFRLVSFVFLLINFGESSFGGVAIGIKDIYGEAGDE